MADADHNPTRRALLGAALAAPLVSARGASTGDREFDEALKAFHTAQAEVLRIEAATAGASMEEEEKWLPRHDAACAAMEDALAQTLAAPAPNLPALAAKLELLFTHAIEPGAVDDDAAASLLADSRRLLLPV